MSVRYQAVGWNPQKRKIDLVAATSVGLFLVVFGAVTRWRSPAMSLEIVLIRGLATAAYLLLHVILLIGPLTRLDRRFLPLLYNRRHLGVMAFVLGLSHAILATLQYHAGGNAPLLVSLLSANRSLGTLSSFPFELLGIAALGILALLAVTSHDFWLSILSPPVWKRLHMLVYLAWGLLVAHVALGTLQAEGDPLLALGVVAGAASVIGAHLVAGWRERRGDQMLPADDDGWVDAGPAGTIPESRARVVMVAGERVAIFRHQNRLSGVSNVCRHQNGPLGEGRIIDGCITCPWHGYQYYPDSGSSPPPFTDTIPTFSLRIRDGRVEVHSRPHPPGTRIDPVPLHDT